VFAPGDAQPATDPASHSVRRDDDRCGDLTECAIGLEGNSHDRSLVANIAHDMAEVHSIRLQAGEAP
jgi:hypothetical protein